MEQLLQRQGNNSTGGIKELVLPVNKILENITPTHVKDGCALKTTYI